MLGILVSCLEQVHRPGLVWDTLGVQSHPHAPGRGRAPVAVEDKILVPWSLARRPRQGRGSDGAPGRKDAACDGAKTHAGHSRTCAADASHGDLVTVLKKLANLSRSPQGHFLAALPAELEHGPEAVLGLAADGPRPEEVARLHVAARHRVVHELLLHVPVHVGKVGASHSPRRIHALALDGHLQGNVVAAVVGVLEVLEGLRVRLDSSRRRAAEWLQGVQGDYPRGDGGRKVLGAEGAQGHVLPLLDVPSAPIVHEHDAKDPVLGLCHGQALPWSTTRPPDEEPHL
mmetsp:Transcript_16871/g.49103  ORF Transcript_16871/g.49103 Transcript_16871/m.49103 type:complete len:287 (+) Transcript_16871:805-1665(+)